MRYRNVVDKFGSDGTFERSWVLPSEVVEPLRAHVAMTDGGCVMDLWPVTTEIAAIVQPWVDQRIDLGSGDWLIGSEQASP